jgi:GNAT superfamily N-acetyltransferase
MLLRPSESDIPAIVDLVNRAYRGWGEQRSWTVEDFIAGPRVDEDEIRQDLADPSVRLRIVRDEASAMPIATVRLQDEGAGLWQLGMLSVDPARQKDGLGQRTMAAAEEIARGEGARQMRLYVVHRRPELLAWYGRRGYRPTGETRPFPGLEDTVGTDARNDLHFLLLEKSL